VISVGIMSRFYEPDLTIDPNSPFVRDASNKLVRRGYWMDMTDQALVMVMTKGIGANINLDCRQFGWLFAPRRHEPHLPFPKKTSIWSYKGDL
jgi:hypothetical protein